MRERENREPRRDGPRRAESSRAEPTRNVLRVNRIRRRPQTAPTDRRCAPPRIAHVSPPPPLLLAVFLSSSRVRTATHRSFYLCPSVFVFMRLHTAKRSLTSVNWAKPTWRPKITHPRIRVAPKFVIHCIAYVCMYACMLTISLPRMYKHTFAYANTWESLERNAHHRDIYLSLIAQLSFAYQRNFLSKSI